METDLINLIVLQQKYINLETYQNEFETMRLVFDLMPEKPRHFVRKSSLLWLQNLEQNENLEFDMKDNSAKIQESENLRQQGNNLFTAKGDRRNVLGACRLYTDAIYAAIDTAGKELAYGFANRAAALQAFGYYQQAYDDCVCALKLGYPDTLRHKIILRQAYCSLKMQDMARAGKHLSNLHELPLSTGLSSQLKELSLTYDELMKSNKVGKEKSNEDEAIPLYRETQEIVTSRNGRQMQAKCHIAENQIIFTERASAFVAVGDTRRLCHQCATVNFIPIPCLHCRGRVNYCSLKCQEEHSGIHKYECKAYRMQLFARVGVAHLALRIMLDNGIFSIIDKLDLEKKKSTVDIWRMLTEAGGDIWSDNNIQYSESLRMITHLDKLPRLEIAFSALVSHLLVVYLKHYSEYFEVLNARSRHIDWELLTASLILLHIGQSSSNGHSMITITPCPLTATTTTDFHMLDENVWLSPWHLKLGFLHSFGNYGHVAAVNLPYLSLCNHSCVEKMRTKFSGRFISTYASRSIEAGEEITYCYEMDYRSEKRATRREKLRENYHFECRCENCLETDNVDKEYNKRYQYRCDNTKCGQIFVSNPLEDKTELDLNIVCTVCGSKQTLSWYRDALLLMHSHAEEKTRRRLYQLFKASERYLLDLSEPRCYFAQKHVSDWFELGYNNLNDQDYIELIPMIKYILNFSKISSSYSLNYVVYMLYLWDLMAKRKYRCSKDEMEEMLCALNILADDTRIIILNYFNDYIKDYLDFSVQGSINF